MYWDYESKDIEFFNEASSNGKQIEFIDKSLDKLKDDVEYEEVENVCKIE